jgi:hypothetical protein
MISQKLGAYIDEDRTVKVKCKYCGAEITFSYNSVGKTGRKLPCKLGRNYA